MNEMLTAKEIQGLLNVDRSTVYRMAETGRIPAVKVGRQWRFQKDRVDAWLSSQMIDNAPVPPAGRHLSQSLPVTCVQMIQDVFADVLGVFTVVADMGGRPVTDVSHAPGLLRLVLGSPDGTTYCASGWAKMGIGSNIEPRYEVGPLGLSYTRGLIRSDNDLAGMVIMGGVAPGHWPPSRDEIQHLSQQAGIAPEVLSAHMPEVYQKDDRSLQRVLSFVQPIADVVAHMMNDRRNLMGRLEAIAQLTRDQL